MVNAATIQSKVIADPIDRPGAILSSVEGLLSPEARVARAAFAGVAQEITDVVSESASGRELATVGRASDVHLASQVDSSTSVPVLTDRTFGQWMP